MKVPMKKETPKDITEIRSEKEAGSTDKILVVDGTDKTLDTSHKEGFDIHYAPDLQEASRLAEEFEQCLVLGTLTTEKKVPTGTAAHMSGITKISKSLQSALTTVHEAMSLEAARLVENNNVGSDQLALISTVNKSLQEALTTVYEAMNNESDRLVECDSGENYVIKPFEDAELAVRLRGLLSSSKEVAELQEEKHRLESLLSIIKSVLSSLNIADIRNVIVTKLAEAIQTKDCSVLLLKKDYDECFVLDSARGLPNSELRVDLNNYPELKKVLDTKEPLAIRNILEHPLMSEVKDSIKDKIETSSMVIPIVFDDPVLGTIFLKLNRGGTEFSEEEMTLCSAVAEASFFAMKNAIIHEEVQKEKDRLKKIAITDHLTNIYNHNYFYKRLAEEFSRASRYDSPLSLIMMDIDDFKQINDLYGHRVGDVVLQQIAGLLKDSVRKADIVARYGGEEFAAILPSTSIEGAIEEAERIRERLERHSFDEIPQKKITISIGIAAYDKKTVMNLGQFVNMADRALYEAKKCGKNCVRVSPPADEMRRHA